MQALIEGHANGDVMMESVSVGVNLIMGYLSVRTKLAIAELKVWMYRNFVPQKGVSLSNDIS
jgi:hypothetical protein